MFPAALVGRFDFTGWPRPVEGQRSLAEIRLTPTNILRWGTATDPLAGPLPGPAPGALPDDPPALAPLHELFASDWRLAILDEAQAIQNPGTRQNRATKTIPAHARIALTGTPVENRLGDLWSNFDSLNPGLPGSVAVFSKSFAALETRRAKTGPRIDGQRNQLGCGYAAGGAFGFSRSQVPQVP